jgi:hypothetical protein
MTTPRAGDVVGESSSLIKEYNVLGGLCVARLVPEDLLLYSRLIRSIQFIFVFLLCSVMISQKG